MRVDATQRITQRRTRSGSTLPGCESGVSSPGGSPGRKAGSYKRALPRTSWQMPDGISFDVLVSQNGYASSNMVISSSAQSPRVHALFRPFREKATEKSKL
jgi:hypothetical protein